MKFRHTPIGKRVGVCLVRYYIDGCGLGDNIARIDWSVGGRGVITKISHYAGHTGPVIICRNL
jgi:hypothetical protein